jgi:hypothetical protein
MADWASIADVDTYTNVTVDADEITRAQAIIEIFAHTTTEASDAGLISSRNLRLLKQAVAYQAAWMTEHPDVFTNVDVTSFSQDGMSASQAHAHAHLLAPLAKRCLDRLSWNLEPLRAHRPRQPYTDKGNRDDAARDDSLPWIPLP